MKQISSAPVELRRKTIAVDIDDTLNNFSETLRLTSFSYDSSYPFPAATFDKYLSMVKDETADQDDLLNPEFGFVRQKINGQCFELSVAKPDASEFMQWLRNEGWRIVICTHRDLRRAEESTRNWLHGNGIPFDYLFIALDKLAFCKDWGIQYLVDDHLYSVRYADDYGINVFYPVLAKQYLSIAALAKGFATFDELRQWIKESN